MALARLSMAIKSASASMKIGIRCRLVRCASLSIIAERHPRNLNQVFRSSPQRMSVGVFLAASRRRFVTEETYQKWMTRGFPKQGDVLFTTEAPLAMAALVNNGERFALAQRIICLSPNAELAIGGYLFRALLSARVQEAIQSAATGATVLGIKASSLKEIEIPVPPLDEQRQIVAELDAEAAQIEAVRASDSPLRS